MKSLIKRSEQIGWNLITLVYGELALLKPTHVYHCQASLTTSLLL